ncbi:MAG: S-layer homology domain-containing protein [Candidatus Gracilibacteria bacterium]
MKIFLATLLFALFAPIAQAEITDNSCLHPFIDVDGHWAEEEICFLYNESILAGYSDRNFLPDNEITRAEFLKISLLNVGYTVYAVQSAAFTDVNPGDWYYQYVTFARSKGFVSGYGDGSFHPNNSITRAEAVTMIMNIADIIEYDAYNFESKFSDVTGTDWFANAVAAATTYGIVDGYGDGTFRPTGKLTRAEAAVIAERVWNELY